MDICYFALKKIEVGCRDGTTRIAEVGDLIPEALSWPHLSGYVQGGQLAVTRVSNLYEDEQDALDIWERTGRFTLYDDRSKTMAERDMRPTGAVSEDERIDGSDKAIEADGLPEPVVVDESSDSTSYTVGMAENEGDAEAAAERRDDENSSAAAEGAADEDSYDTWTVAELKAELDSRSVAYDTTDKKADLVALLEQDDAAPQ